MAWVVVVGLMGHGVGLMFCGVALYQRRETKRKREKEIEMMMNKKEYLNEVAKKINPLILRVL